MYVPSNVLGTSIKPIRPVGEGLCVWVEMAEGVNKSLPQESSEPISLLLGEASCLVVIGLGVLEV